MGSTRRKKARTQPSLTSARVRDEALKLIEADGLEEFSTRKLGRALGVEAMAIYWYYPSKDALLDAVVETLVAKLDAPDPESLKNEAGGGAAAAAADAETAGGGAQATDFIDALRRLAHGYRALAHAYPEAFQLLATRRFASEGTYRFLDGLFALAEQYGLDARTTARFYRLVASFCNGIALDELAGVRELETRPEAIEARLRVPRLAKVFAWLSPEHYEDVFSFGLELLLESLQRATSKATTASTKAPKKKTAAKKAR